MAQLIEVSDEDLKAYNQLGLKYKLRSDLENLHSDKDLSNFIYVPSINLYFSRERKFLGENWFNSHKKLQKNGERMPTIPEFVELLKYSKENDKELYNEITEVKNPWRAEWLDADFKFKDEKLYINYNHVLDSNGNLIPKNSEIIDKDTLMSDKTPGISLEDWIEGKNTNSQGFPNKKIKSGNLYYWFPRNDNNSVARFDAYDGRAAFVCNRLPSSADSYLGVRAVKRE